VTQQRLKLLWDYTAGSRKFYFLALAATLLSTVLGLITPQINAFLLDNVLGTEPYDLPLGLNAVIDAWGGLEFVRANLWIFAVVMLLLAAITAFVNFARQTTTAIASESIARRIKEDLYDHIQNLPYDYHVKAQTGDLIQRCTTDVETTRRFLADRVVELIRVFFMLIVSFTLLIRIHATLAVLALCLVPWLAIFCYLYMKKVSNEFTNVEVADGILSTVMQENFTGVRVVRAFGRERYEMEKFNTRNDDFKDKAYHLNVTFAKFWSISDVFSAVPQMIVSLIGIYLTVKGELTLGDYVVFLSYLGMMMWPIRHLGRTLSDIGKAMIAVGRIQDILNEKVETSGDNPVEADLKQDIVFDHVTFGYEQGKPVLNDFSFTIPAGKTVAILGATGSGKSTLAYLLQRLYEYDEGSIRVGGVELKTIDKHHLRKRVGIVLQEPFLYSKTIRENIAITNPELDDEAIFEATRVASVHDVICEFEKGYETEVGERGVTLSGGQKQRVAIARTLVRDSDVLIFDDSLSAVDTETDAAIRKALGTRRQGITTLIISHRISTLMEADVILVLEDGKAAQVGTHEELIHQDGLYKRVWNIQNALIEEEEEVQA